MNGCLGKYGNCEYHGGREQQTRVLGYYCLDGWREQAKHYNTFFTNIDGSPFIQIPDEEAWAQEMYEHQLASMDD